MKTTALTTPNYASPLLHAGTARVAKPCNFAQLLQAPAPSAAQIQSLPAVARRNPLVAATRLTNRAAVARAILPFEHLASDAAVIAGGAASLWLGHTAAINDYFGSTLVPYTFPVLAAIWGAGALIHAGLLLTQGRAGVLEESAPVPLRTRVARCIGGVSNALCGFPLAAVGDVLVASTMASAKRAYLRDPEVAEAAQQLQAYVLAQAAEHAFVEAQDLHAAQYLQSMFDLRQAIGATTPEALELTSMLGAELYLRAGADAKAEQLLRDAHHGAHARGEGCAVSARLQFAVRLVRASTSGNKLTTLHPTWTALGVSADDYRAHLSYLLHPVATGNEYSLSRMFDRALPFISAPGHQPPAGGLQVISE